VHSDYLFVQRRGDLVACKVFRSDVSQREEVARQREFKVMTELKHENIVKFIAVEQEVHTVCLLFYNCYYFITEGAHESAYLPEAK